MKENNIREKVNSDDNVKNKREQVATEKSKQTSLTNQIINTRTQFKDIVNGPHMMS
jgi:hypothetical protein